jgi:hypothetical protein
VRVAALIVDSSLLLLHAAFLLYSTSLLTHSLLSSLPQTSTSLHLQYRPVLFQLKTITLTSICQTTSSFTSSPPAPNPLARARPLQSWEQHGTGTQHIAHRTSPSSTSNCSYTPPSSLPANPCLTSPPRDKELNHLHHTIPTDRSLAPTYHLPPISDLKTRERRAHPPRPPAGS